MSDGTIYLINSKGQQTRLVGHLSRISKLKADGIRLYSSSYDGMMNLWLTNSAKIEPMTLFTTRGWIINFTFDLKKTNVWTGDQNGNLTKALISVPQMQQRLQDKLKRNLTREEWNYYVGRNVPYEEIKGKEARP
jgi:WD40 repeat protein